MNPESLRSSPFALMLAPEEVFRALQQSDSLNRLHSRICRPLDKAVPTSVINNVVAADAEIDAAPDELLMASDDQEESSEGNTLN
ncbi:MAG: hypothetical protein ACJ8G7_07415 [Rhizobacter sp.]